MSVSAALKILGVAADVVEQVIQVKKQRSSEELAVRRKMAKADPISYFRQFSRRVHNDESTTSKTDNGVCSDRTSAK